MDISTLDCRLTSAIRQNFKEYQVEVALKSIRPPQYIEVITRRANTEILHVVEIDVVPHSRVVDLQTFCVKGKKKASYDFYRYQNVLWRPDRFQCNFNLIFLEVLPNGTCKSAIESANIHITSNNFIGQ
jgi:hypothetical protein